MYPPEQPICLPKLPKQNRKLGIIGPAGVGKSTFLKLIISNKYEAITQATVGLSAQTWKVGEALFQVYDTAGTESFNSQLTFYLKHVDILIIGVQRPDAGQIAQQAKIARKYCQSECQIILVILKCDQYPYDSSLDFQMQAVCDEEGIQGWTYISSYGSYGLSTFFQEINWKPFQDNVDQQEK